MHLGNVISLFQSSTLCKRTSTQAPGKCLLSIFDILPSPHEEVKAFLKRCFHGLWSTSKKLHVKGRIFSWYVSNRSIEIKLQENSRPLYISHMEDFKKYFPDVDFHSL